MISNPFFLISILISALIAFMTVVVIVESSLVLFKVKPGRVRAVLRVLPFLSLFLDLLLNSFSIGYWLNPLNCSSCVQKMLLTLFFPALKNYLYSQEMSLLNYLGSNVSHAIFSMIFVVFATVALYLTSRVFFEGFFLTQNLRSMMVPENVSRRSIENESLASLLQKNNVKIFSTEKLTVPMVSYSRAIFLPKEIVKIMPQVEFEAIIAHELEHLLWRDPLIRLFTQLILAIFWWVPTRSWQKKLEFDQEIACDQSILKYGLNQKNLASAIVKVTLSAKEKARVALCYLSEECHPSLRRVQIMLGLSSMDTDRYEWMSYIVAVTSMLVGLVCLMWR